MLQLILQTRASALQDSKQFSMTEHCQNQPVNCDQLRDDDGLCGHKDPQRLEHLSKESCL